MCLAVITSLWNFLMAKWPTSSIPVTSDFPLRASELAKIRSRVLIPFASSPYWTMKLSRGLVIRTSAVHSNRLGALKTMSGVLLWEILLSSEWMELAKSFCCCWLNSGTVLMCSPGWEADRGFIRCSELRNCDMWQMLHSQAPIARILNASLLQSIKF